MGRAHYRWPIARRGPRAGMAAVETMRVDGVRLARRIGGRDDGPRRARLRLGLRRDEGGRAAERQGEREGRAAADRALYPDAPAVERDELPGQGESEPGALDGAARGAHLAELLEHRLVVLGRDADPGVGDRDLDRVVPERGPHVDAPAFRGELEGVGEQVEEHLLHLALVGAR